MTFSGKYALFFTGLCLTTSLALVVFIKVTYAPSETHGLFGLTTVKDLEEKITAQARAAEEEASQQGEDSSAAQTEQPESAGLSQAKSELESSISTLDWPYTLRAGADYDGIAALKETTRTELEGILVALNTNQADSVIDGKICAASGHLKALRKLYAPGLDNTQVNVDTSNTKVFDNLDQALIDLQTNWIQATGASTKCPA